MAVHYIIDGYNVVKQVHFLTGLKLRDGRDGLVRFIEQYRPQGSRRNQVTIVFDGSDEVDAPQIPSSVRVLFSKRESADDKIKRMVETSRNPRCLIVVSDDKAIKFYCRAAGAACMSVKDFLTPKSASPLQAEADASLDKPDPDDAVAARITEQLKAIWLKSKGGNA